MAGKHRHQPHAVHVQLQLPAQRGPRPVGITDARTRIEHSMTDESAARHRHSGRYLALCGVQVLAASLATPSRGRCGACVKWGAR